MSMRAVIKSIEHDAFSKCINNLKNAEVKKEDKASISEFAEKISSSKLTEFQKEMLNSCEGLLNKNISCCVPRHFGMPVVDKTMNELKKQNFIDCMNPPQDGWDRVADVKTFPDGSKWVICPFCKKKAIKVLPDTQIHNMPWKCRGSNCGKEFIVNVGDKI